MALINSILTIALLLLIYSTSVNARTVILGFDGMDPEMVSQWMDEDLLPNFARLRKNGHFSPLATSNPPQSPVAWAEFATGSHPGLHGIYDFLHRNPESYQPEFSIYDVSESSGFSMGPYLVPVKSGHYLNKRQGEAFWMTLERMGGHATVQRVPASFPPDPVHAMISGMGIPDLLGSQGKYTLFSNNRHLNNAENGGQLVRIKPDKNGYFKSTIPGPVHPLRQDGLTLDLPIKIQKTSDHLAIKLPGSEFILKEGEWSEWISVDFSYLGLFDLSGMLRMKLVELGNTFALYVSPIQVDPMADDIGISHPASYARELAESIGPYHTLGMPEETWSLNQGHVDDATFLDMIKSTLKEREAMLMHALEDPENDLVITVFVQTDRVSHMFYRGFDSGHPLYKASTPEARQAIQWIYREADRILGNTLEKLNADDTLLVISDHGFKSFRHVVHLNSWLHREGYLAFKEGYKDSDSLFAQVDWQNTRAYALGLNGLYLNIKDREKHGIVWQKDINKLLDELSTKLIAWRDSQNGSATLISEVFQGNEIYPDSDLGLRPDLVVGYAPNYRASWQTSLGGAPAKPLIEDNLQKWSGDHCMAPQHVPGIFFSNKPLDDIPASIRDIRQLVLPGFRESH